MRIYLIVLIPIILYSCSEKKESDSCTNLQIKERIEFTKEVLHESSLIYEDLHKGGNPKFSYHTSKIYEMIRKIEAFLSFGEGETIDFSDAYKFFNNQRIYKIEFFKNKQMCPSEALFVIDQLIYTIRTSELGNDYFKYSTPKFSFIESDNGDSLDISIGIDQMLRKFAFIGPKSYCDSTKFLENNAVDLWDQKLDISKYNIGDTVRGGILMRKMNYPVYIPFEFVKSK